jgi:hypothetical protein
LTEDRYRIAAQKIARRTALQEGCLAFEQFISWALQRRTLKRATRVQG